MSDATPALVLVPGLLSDAAIFAAQIEAIGGLARVTVAEHGAIDSLTRMADAVLASAPPRFAVLGHSMGGRVALEIVRRAPGRVLGLALLNTGAAPLACGAAGEEERTRRHALLALACAQGMEVMARQWIRGMVHPQRVHDSALIEPIVAMLVRRTPEILAAQIRALLARPDATGVLDTVACPTLVLCGREDASAPPEQHRQMACRIPGSRLAEVAQCGHMSPLERPDSVSSELGRWLGQIGALPGAEQGAAIP